MWKCGEKLKRLCYFKSSGNVKAWFQLITNHEGYIKVFKWNKLCKTSTSIAFGAITQYWSQSLANHSLLPCLAVPPAVWLASGLGGSYQWLPRQAWKGFWVLLPVGGLCS